MLGIDFHLTTFEMTFRKKIFIFEKTVVAFVFYFAPICWFCTWWYSLYFIIRFYV
jgi:hypothetical protein